MTAAMRVFLLLATIVPAFAIASAPTPVVFTCPVTLSGDNRPPDRMDPFAPDDSVHYADGIWVTIPADGMLLLGEDTEIGFGRLQGWRVTTVTWTRDDGVEGWVIVSGERLDAASDLSPRTPLSPQRQYVQAGFVKTGIAFPTEGCWQLTGTVGDHSITWVVDAAFVNGVATPDE